MTPLKGNLDDYVTVLIMTKHNIDFIYVYTKFSYGVWKHCS